jgi:hypothetical protein
MDPDKQKGLVDYLRFHVESRAKLNIPTPDGFHYSCMEDFVLREGRDFDHFSPRNGTYQRGGFKACFHNAYVACVRARGRLRYVEGYADGSIMPVHHAWCVDENDGVVDTTWEGTWVDPGGAYRGVVIPMDLLKEIRSEDNCCALDQWQKGWPLMRTPWSEVIAA